MDKASDLHRAYAAFARRDYALAASLARQVLARDAADPGALTLFGRLALVAHEPDVAAQIFRGLLDHPQAGAATWLDLSQALQDLHRTQEAIDAARQALTRDERSVAAHLRLGALWLSAGERAASAAAFRAALALDPASAPAYRGLSQAEDLSIDAPETQRMAKLAASAPAREAADLHYSLAQIHRKAGQDARFIEHLLKANALQSGGLEAARAQYDESYDRLEAAFTRSAFARTARPAASGPAPIFVLGMPRSGTTLVERILAAHPGVVAAGELDYMRGPLRRALEQRTGKPFPVGFDSLPSDALTALAQAYSKRLSLISGPGRRVTDKTPGNFHVLGLLRILFPHAKIVHVARDPMDTCFSILQYPFDERSPHTCDMELLAHSYGRYRRLMRRWEELFPGEFITVQYEELVANPQEQGRRLFGHCGLEWQDEYAHARSGGSVRTFSATQVRRPIYQSSVGAWRPYAKALEPLQRALEAELKKV